MAMEGQGGALDVAGTDGAEYVARVRALGPMIAAAAAEIEAKRELTPAIVKALIDNGLFRVLQPRFLGGAELDPASFAEVCGEIAKYDASTAWCLGQSAGCSMAAAFLDPKVAQDIFGPPDGIVAWGPVGPAQLRKVPGGYRLTGSWRFASGSHHASWLGAHVVERGADGEPLRRDDGGEIVRTLLFPKSSTEMTDIWRVVGLRATGSDAYSVTDLFVPEEYTVLRDPRIPARQPGRLYRFSSSNLYASGFAGLALGIARGMFDAFIELARDKTPRGARATLRENNVIQSQVAQCHARLGSARAYLLRSLQQIWDEVGRTGEVSREHNATIRLASTWAIHQARDVVALLYNAAGATAIFEENPFERRFRDMFTASQQAQGQQAHFETVGRILLGLEGGASMFTF